MWFSVVLLFLTTVALSVDFSISMQSTCYSSYSIRLYNPQGSTATQGGMLQICISSRWRAVCDYGFDCQNEGKAACRQLGFSGSQIKSYVLANSAKYFGTWSYTDSYYYYCPSGGYSSLTSCSRRYRPYYSYCDSNDQVGLWCAATACNNGAVRLVGGKSSNEGRLEYCYNGAWSRFCNQNFHNEEAVAACRQLGYTNPKAVIITDQQRFEQGSTNYSLINYFSCPSSSSERNLSSCSLYTSQCAIKCTGNNIGISCYEQDGCREGAVRLVNSTVEYEGRVEVCLDGVWGTICDIDQFDAAVICRTAGFDKVLEFYSTNQMFGDGGRPIFYSLQCSGCESHIIACSKTAYPHIYCNKGSVAGVRCNHGCIDGEVRLIGGSSGNEGTVEVCHNKTWGMVSGLGWGEEDARVTCRQLKFLVDGSHSYVDSPFGKPRRTVHFSSVQCVGNESRITDCLTTNYTYEQGKQLVEHLAVAGVTCTHYCPISTVTQVKTVTEVVTAHHISPTQQGQSNPASCHGYILAVSLIAVVFIISILIFIGIVITIIVCCHHRQNNNNCCCRRNNNCWPNLP